VGNTLSLGVADAAAVAASALIASPVMAGGAKHSDSKAQMQSSKKMHHSGKMKQSRAMTSDRQAVAQRGGAWDDDSDATNEETGKKGEKVDEPQGPADAAQAESMWALIEDKMSKSTADYLFVVGHYPAYSTTRHNVNHCLALRLQDLLEKYNANGYLCGHAHNLQHVTTTSRTSGATIHHVLSGGGHLVKANHKKLKFKKKENVWNAESQFFFPSDDLKADYESKKDQKKMGAFVYASLGLTSGTFEYHNCKGEFLYSFQVVPRTPKS